MRIWFRSWAHLTCPHNKGQWYLIQANPDKLLQSPRLHQNLGHEICWETFPQPVQADIFHLAGKRSVQQYLSALSHVGVIQVIETEIGIFSCLQACPWLGCQRRCTWAHLYNLVPKGGFWHRSLKFGGDGCSSFAYLWPRALSTLRDRNLVTSPMFTASGTSCQALPSLENWGHP